MSKEQSTQSVAQALAEDWELALTPTISEEEILQLLEEKVSAMLTRSPEVFFTLMYRLDIPEQKLMSALEDPSTGVRMVAKLIFNRQVQKFESRKASRHSDDDREDEELKW